MIDNFMTIILTISVQKMLELELIITPKKLEKDHWGQIGIHSILGEKSFSFNVFHIDFALIWFWCFTLGL